MNLVQRLFIPPTSRGQLATTSNERAASVGVQTTGRYHGIQGAQMNEWDAEQAVRQAYLVNAVVFRCVQILAEKIASLPFRTGAKPPAKLTDQADFDINAPLSQLLGPPPGSPNPDATPSALWMWTVAQWLITGRYGWEMEWSGKVGRSEVVALWPLLSRLLLPTPADSGPYYFKSFRYNITPNPRDLSREQCHYDWRPGQTDWRQPETPLQAARLDASVAVMLDVYDRAFLMNGGVPANVVITQKFAEESQYEAFKERFNGEYQGPQNAGKTIVQEVDSDGSSPVGSLLDVKILGQSAKDMQSVEKYKQKTLAICTAFGVPYSKLDASARTFDNADEENETFWRDTVVPLATQLSQGINLRLAPLVGREVGWFDLSDIPALQPQRRYQPVLPTDAYAAGLLSLNEVRGALGEEPLDDDLAKQVKALEDLKNPPPPPEAFGLPGDPALADPNADPKALPAAQDNPAEDKPKADPKNTPKNPPAAVASSTGGKGRGTPTHGKSAVAPAPTTRTTISEANNPGLVSPSPLKAKKKRREKAWAEVDAHASALEAVWESQFRSLFRRQRDATLSRLEGKRGRQALRDSSGGQVSPALAAAIFDQSYWEAETADLASGLYSTVAAAAGARMASQFEQLFSVTDPAIVEYVNQRASNLANPITQTTVRALQGALADGIAAGEDSAQIAERVSEVFDLAATNRSSLIGRSEVMGTWNGVTEIVGRGYGGSVVAANEWVTQPGAHHPRHELMTELDGQVRGVGESFQVGEAHLKYPGDPSGPSDQTVACRCLLNPLGPSDYMDALRSQPTTQYRSAEEVKAELIRIATGAAA